MIRVFDYINVSNAKDIWADSGYHVQRNVVNYILRKRKDFFFYITVPKNQVTQALKGFEFPEHVKLIPVLYSTGGRLNKLFLDLKSIREKFKWNHYFISILWSNEAYLTPVLMHVFKGLFPFNEVSVATYVHWVEIPEFNKVGSQYIGNWLLWLLATSMYWSDYTFFNSKYGISLVEPYLRKFLRGDIYETIMEKTRPLYLGVPVRELDKYKTKECFSEVSFVFNQRLMKYTGATKVIKTAMKLADEGYKFKLFLTNPSAHSIELPYANEKYRDKIVLLHGLPYNEYVKLLWKADAVIAWHTGLQSSFEDKPVNQWTIALLEAVVCNCYPIVHSGGFFQEMLPKEFLLEPNERSLYNAMASFIESPEYFKKKVSRASVFVREKYDWEVRVNDWIAVLEELYNISKARASKPLGKTVEKIEKIVEKRGKITWFQVASELNWGLQVRVGRMGVYYWLQGRFKEIVSPEPTFVVEKPSKYTKLSRWF